MSPPAEDSATATLCPRSFSRAPTASACAASSDAIIVSLPPTADLGYLESARFPVASIRSYDVKVLCAEVRTLRPHHEAGPFNSRDGGRPPTTDDRPPPDRAPTVVGGRWSVVYLA